MRLGDMNAARMPGHGDRETYGFRSNDPQNAVDGPEPCSLCDDRGCADCDDEYGLEPDYEPDTYDDGRWNGP